MKNISVLFSWWLKTFSLINFFSLKTNKINYSNPYSPSCYDWKLQFSQAEPEPAGFTFIPDVKFTNTSTIVKVWIKWYFLNYFLSYKNCWPAGVTFTRLGQQLYWIFHCGDESQMGHRTSSELKLVWSCWSCCSCTTNRLFFCRDNARWCLTGSDFLLVLMITSNKLY